MESLIQILYEIYNILNTKMSTDFFIEFSNTLNTKMNLLIPFL